MLFCFFHLLDVGTNVAVIGILMNYTCKEERPGNGLNGGRFETMILMIILLIAWAINGTLCAYMAIRSDPWVLRNRNPGTLVVGIIFLGYLQLIHIRIAYLRYVKMKELDKLIPIN